MRLVGNLQHKIFSSHAGVASFQEHATTLAHAMKQTFTSQDACCSTHSTPA